MIKKDNLFKNSQSNTSLVPSETQLIDWYQRCIYLELSLKKLKAHSNKIKEVLLEKAFVLEKKIKEIEMNSKDESLAHLQKVVEEKQKLINNLENQIEEQKKLRIQDARQVEVKAAKIKEWVSAKFKELEEQNKSLREENKKFYEYLTILQNFLSVTNTNENSKNIKKIDSFFANFGTENHPFNLNSLQTNLASTSTYAVIDPKPKKSTPIKDENNQIKNNQSESKEISKDIQSQNLPNKNLEHKPFYPIPPPRSHVANYSNSNYVNTPFTPQLPKKLYNNLDSKSSLKRGGSLDRKLTDKQKMNLRGQKTQLLNAALSNNTDLDGNDYSEVCTSDCESNLTIEKPPTPPLHRIPSWKERIYKVASNGIKNISTNFVNLKNLTNELNLSCSLTGHSDTEASVFQIFSQNITPMFANFHGQAFQIRSNFYSDNSSDSSEVDTDLNLAHSNSLQKSENKHSSGFKDQDSLNDYTLPPDAGLIKPLTYKSPPNAESSLNPKLKTIKRFSSIQREIGACIVSPESIQKFGHLTKLGSRLKTWNKRWFVLKNNELSYYKSQSEVLKGKAKAVTFLDETCSISRANGCTFHLSLNNGKKVYYLTADSSIAMEDWIRHIRNAIKNNSFISENQKLNGTNFEKLVSKLMNGDNSDNKIIDNNLLWNNSCLLFSKETLDSPLTTLSTNYLRSEALKLFKSIQLFTSIALDFSAIDYHVSLIQNFFQLCLDHSELQNELFSQLIKQTSFPSSDFQAIHHSSVVSSQKMSSPTMPFLSKKENNGHSLKQGFQLLSLAISLFIPKENILWLLKHHLRRNENTETETGKYAIYAHRALKRTLLNGPRECRPSRMEVLGILLRNPFQHSKPHSFLVHFINFSYLVIGFDGSTTINEFVCQLTKEANLRASHLSGFALFSDDPLDSKVEHLLKGKVKLADVISRWESLLREKHFGKFENTRVLKLTYKNRLCLKRYQKSETDKEKLLLVYQYQDDMKNGRFPLNYQLSLELSALLAQMEFGDISESSITEDLKNKIAKNFISYPRENNLTNLAIQEIFTKWKERKGCNQIDCARIFLKCARKWDFCGAGLFNAQTRNEIKTEKDNKMVKINSKVDLWIAVMESGISLLDYSFQHLVQYSFNNVLTFGNYKDDFTLVVCSSCNPNYTDDNFPLTLSSFNDSVTNASNKCRMLFSMSKNKLNEITLLIADYINSNQTTDAGELENDQILDNFSPNTFLQVSFLPQTKL